MLFPLLAARSLQDADCDCVVIVGDDPERLGDRLQPLQAAVSDYCRSDAAASSEGAVSLVTGQRLLLAAGRCVFSNTGPLNRDYDDSRRLYDAAGSGMRRAVAAGSRRPLLAVAELRTLPSATEAWAADAECLERCCVLGAMQLLYSPLQAREAGRTAKVQSLAYLAVGQSDAAVERQRTVLVAMETGRILARDIGGSDPERMTAGRIAERIRSELGADNCGSVEVEVEERVDGALYPLMAAVDRAASGVGRHAGRVVHLRYAGAEARPGDDALLLVGKGITYDTGGADVKAGGVMAGMHRDKCGAAAVAGFFRLLQLLRPPRLRAEASLAFVRNSIGSDCYVSDEIISARSGVRVRVGNTDAEGRMVMADLLCLMRERALRLPEPSAASLFTVATLTGHVIRAYGDGYSAAMDNGPARRRGTAVGLQAAGDLVADPFEVSTIRREDYTKVAGRSESEDVLQANNLPSSATPRGHQFPAAFLIRASGLDKHGADSEQPLAYTHIDMAGSAGEPPEPTTGSPLLALAARYVLPRLP